METEAICRTCMHARHSDTGKIACAALNTPRTFGLPPDAAERAMLELIELTTHGRLYKRSAAISGNLAWLKYLGLAAMVFDHVTVGMLSVWKVPDAIARGSLWRLPGRISIPIFAFLVAYSFLHYTKDKRRFVARLWLCAAISEPIYFLYFRECGNAMIPLALGASWLLLDGTSCRGKEGVGYALSVVGLGALLSVVTDNLTVLTVSLLVWCFHRAEKEEEIGWITIIAVLIMASNHIGLGELGMTVATLSLIKLCTGSLIVLPRARANKWLAYAFYPGHLLALYCAVYWLM